MDTERTTLRHWRPWVVLAGFIVAVTVTSLLGGRATAPNTDGWYAEADRPFFTPPDAVFTPVWLTLYFVIALAAWLAWRAQAELGWWWIQLGLNLAWPWTFFAAQWLWFGGIVILALAAAIVMTMRAFWPRSRPAALLLVPYLAWIAYATALTFGVASLN